MKDDVIALNMKFRYKIFIDFNIDNIEWAYEFIQNLNKKLKSGSFKIPINYIYEKDLDNYLICAESEIPRFFTRKKVINNFLLESRILIVLLDELYINNDWKKIEKFHLNKTPQQKVFIIIKEDNIIPAEQHSLLLQYENNIYEFQENSTQSLDELCKEIKSFITNIR